MKTSICTILLVVLCILIFQPDCLLAQVAGNVPPGTSIVSNPVELRVIENENDTTTYFDIDGDALNDVRVWLLKGNPPSDGSSVVFFYALGNKYSFCTEAESPVNVNLYNIGDTLCSAGFIWGVDSLYVVGCYAGWNCSHDTAAVYDKYVAYKNNATGEIGWIKISMSLYSQVDQIPVTFTISEMLVLYLGSSALDAKDIIHYDVLPNPTFDGKFVIESEQKLSGIEIFNFSGQCIITYNDSVDEYTLPDSKGVYIIRAMDRKGNYSIRKIVRF